MILPGQEVEVRFTDGKSSMVLTLSDASPVFLKGHWRPPTGLKETEVTIPWSSVMYVSARIEDSIKVPAGKKGKV